MSTTTIKLPTDHNYLASLPDGTRDELVLRSDGVAVLVTRTAKIASYAGESVTTSYRSTTGALTTGATVIYGVPPTTKYSADNGTTWSTTDPAAGQSAIPMHKGTNNVWCTDSLSPTIMLNYDTQERTRKRRISDLYWLGNEPKKRLTWGQLATHTWRDIGSKSVQEWYFGGTAEVVENAYINYEIGEL